MDSILTSLLAEFVYDDSILDRSAKERNMYAILRANDQGRLDGAYACPVCGVRTNNPLVATDCCEGHWDEGHFMKGIKHDV